MEVIKEVEVRREVPVVKHCPVVVETITKEVIEEVPVEVIKEVIKEVPVEVPVEVIREVPVEIIRTVIKEVQKEVKEEVEEGTTGIIKPSSVTARVNFQRSGLSCKESGTWTHTFPKSFGRFRSGIKW